MKLLHSMFHQGKISFLTRKDVFPGFQLFQGFLSRPSGFTKSTEKTILKNFDLWRKITNTIWFLRHNGKSYFDNWRIFKSRLSA